MNRRQAATAGLGALAIGAGAWWSLQRESSQATRTADGGPGSIWTMSFPRPDGSALAMSGFRGKPLVLNFWATWCEPCLREMPALDRFAKDFAAQHWQVLGLAIDAAPKVLAFLSNTPVSFPIALADAGGLALARKLGNDAGALPFTLVLSARGEILHRKMGESRYEDLVSIAARGGA